jgi:cytochrome c biogenesis protein CcmG, thiol:disulfide interchange protein DsbE
MKIRRCWRLPVVLSLFLALAIGIRAQVAPGMHEADLLALKGEPLSKMAAGAKVIYGWPDLQVVVVDGVVTKVLGKNAAAENAAADRRARIATEAKNPVPQRIVRARELFVQSETGKQLWAKSYLGQPAPPLVVEKWLNDSPAPGNGKFRVIDFWATWCGPCRRAIPELNQIKRQFGDRVDVIGISDESELTVRSMHDPAIDYFVGIDTLARTKSALQVTGIPHVIIVDPSGIVRWEGYPLLQGHELKPEVVQKVLDLYSE